LSNIFIDLEADPLETILEISAIVSEVVGLSEQ